MRVAAVFCVALNPPNASAECRRRTPPQSVAEGRAANAAPPRRCPSPMRRNFAAQYAGATLRPPLRKLRGLQKASK